MLQAAQARLPGFLQPGPTYEAGRRKIFFIGLGFTLFFLVFGRFDFPGGARHFVIWADQYFGPVPGEIAQRDVGYPLLLILTGYTVFGSFIGITLLNGVFAAVMPLLVHGIIGRKLPHVAFYGALIFILTAAPYVFIKMIHHDHAYIFFTLLTLYLGITFLRKEAFGYLYLMTLAALAASLVRPTGNLYFAVALCFVFLAFPRRIYHYAICAMIFAATLATYAAYRNYVGLSDPKHKYTGQQIFYGAYVNSRAFGIELDSSFGPATARLLTSLRTGLEKNPVDSQGFRYWIDGQRVPAAVIDAQFRPFTAEQLARRVVTHPQYDYFELLCYFEQDDRVFFDSAIEIWKRYPLYPVGYTMRNAAMLATGLGFGHPRFRLEYEGMTRFGVVFMPLQGGVVQTDGLAPRALREVNFDLVGGASWTGLAFKIWTVGFLLIVGVCGALSVVAIFGAFYAERDVRISVWFPALTAIYNAAIICAFSDPISRYHFIIVPEEIICGAMGAYLLHRHVMWLRERGAAAKIAGQA